MVNRHVFILLSFASFFIGCRKDPKLVIIEPTDTITPPPPTGVAHCESDTAVFYLNDTTFTDPYIAAYPGSNWLYSDGTAVTCDLAEFNVITHSFTEQPEGYKCHNYIYEYIHAPKLTNWEDAFFSSPCVNGNTFMKNVQTQSDISSPYYTQTHYYMQVDTIVSTWCSYGFEQYVNWTYVSASKTLVEALDSFILPNNLVFYDVLHVTEQIDYQDKLGDYETVNCDIYFSKDVGIIKYYKEPGFYLGAEMDRYLESYYIAPH